VATLYEIVNKTISSFESLLSWEWLGCGVLPFFLCPLSENIKKSKQVYTDYQKLLFPFGDCPSCAGREVLKTVEQSQTLKRLHSHKKN